MIAVARWNLSCLYTNPSSIFLCNSAEGLFLPINLFSTSTVNNPIPRSGIYDVLVNNHQFSPAFASLVAWHLPKSKSPKIADSALSFLKENRFTSTQLQKIITYDPRILGFSAERIDSKLQVFRDLGFSSEEIAKLMTSNQSILHSAVKNTINRSVSLLKSLLGSDDDVARLLRRSGRFAVTDLKKTLVPNLEVLKGHGVPMERVLHHLRSCPGCFLIKPDCFKKSVDMALEIGVPWSSSLLPRAASVLAAMGDGMWEAKLQAFREMGFSDNDVLTMFRRSPCLFSIPLDKVKKKVELLVGCGKYNISSIVSDPVSLTCSLEERLEPRVQVFLILESKNLIKWPSIKSVYMPDDKFLERFVRPYSRNVGYAFSNMSYLKGRITET